MVRDQCNGAPGASNGGDQSQHKLGHKLESNQQCGRRQGYISSIIVAQDNSCDVQPFDQNSTENGEEGRNESSSHEAIERTNGSNRPNYSIKENPKQIRIQTILILPKKNS